MRLGIDFDGVVHDHLNPQPGGKMGGLIEGASEALDELYQDGHYLIIHTVKANTPSGRKAVADWLEFFAIDYHEIAPKPDCDYYIDDKSIEFKNWNKIMDRFDG